MPLCWAAHSDPTANARRRASDMIFFCMPPCFSLDLEIEFQRDLNLPRRACRQREAESGLTEFERGRFGADGAKLAKQVIHVVQHIEKFRAELETLVLADRKLLDQRGVPLFISRALDDVASGVAECSEDGVVREGAGVE